MRFKYDGSKLSKAIRTKRLIELDIDVREAAKIIGTSAATLSRAENGKTPDLLTLATLCHWADVDFKDCVLPFKQRKSSK